MIKHKRSDGGVIVITPPLPPDGSSVNRRDAKGS